MYRGGPESGRKKFEKCLPAGTGTKIYFSRIVSQNSFVLVFVGYRTIIARYVAKWGIAQMCLCEIKYQGGGIAPFGGRDKFF